MRSPLLAVTVVAALMAAGCSAGSERSSLHGLQPIGAGLRGTPGLQATVYARGLPNVSAFAFDRTGRLWATTAGNSDRTGDGVFVVARAGTKPLNVVSGLTTPLGLAWYRDRLYVASLGRVDAFSGFDGSRFANRQMILRGPAVRGENNNLVVSPDGRLLMGISAPCDHCTPASKWFASIVSFRPDGSDRRLYATGIRAPVGLAYDPNRNDLFATMNQRDDLGAKTPGDWLAVVRPGQDWGFPDCFGQGGPSCAGVPEPVAELDPHAAAGGVAIVDAGSSALVAEWALGKVQRVALTATKASVSAFLTGMKHPLAVLAAGDGTLFVGDWGTGTIYRIARD
jgi:glucose/arabinose dehydrogenase